VAGNRPTRKALRDGQLGLAAICVFVVALGIWNVAHYPTGLGYDASAHQAYADGLVPGGRFPQHTGEYYTPPGYYAVAGSLDWIAGKLGSGNPDRAGQLVNVLFLLGTVLLVARIARELWPGRERIALGAAAFVALLPVTVETEAMFHPETMSLFFSTLAIWLCIRVFADARYAWALGAALGAAQLVRAWALWTVAAAAIALFAGRRWQQLGIVLVLAALIPAPWYIHQRVKYGGQPEFPQPVVAAQQFGPSFYLDPGLPSVITRPYRPHSLTKAIPTTYDSIWGDYFGIWAWRRGSPIGTTGTFVSHPSSSARRYLELQSLVGLLPTLLALIGWIALARSSLRNPPRLALALLPLLGLIGYLYFAVRYWTADADLLKATYMLTATSGWALGFGYALDRLRGRAWQVTVALLALCALVELPFIVF
jgi:Dolichyl-phosphate-mannose-protein mannosyltransferase